METVLTLESLAVPISKITIPNAIRLINFLSEFTQIKLTNLHSKRKKELIQVLTDLIEEVYGKHDRVNYYKLILAIARLHTIAKAGLFKSQTGFTKFIWRDSNLYTIDLTDFPNELDLNSKSSENSHGNTHRSRKDVSEMNLTVQKVDNHTITDRTEDLGTDKVERLGNINSINVVNLYINKGSGKNKGSIEYHKVIETRLTGNLKFEESPLYKRIRIIGNPQISIGNSLQITTLKWTIKLSKSEVDILNAAKKSGNGAATILLNMGALDAINTFSEHKIEYPENVLAKFNGTVLVVNESLSDYPEPIDLFSKTVVNFKLHNTLEISFSSRKRMLLTVELAEANSEQEFVNYLRKYQQFSKEKVLQGMCRGDNDEDLIQTKSYLSLKCVLGQCRIKVPVRSKYCTHSQCFDATTFFCLFRGSPSFICPICQTNIRNLKSLFIDAYFEDILKHYSNSDCDQVEVNPDGSWKIPPSLHPYKRASIDIADEEIGQKKKNCSDASFSSLGNEICNLSADSINIHFLLNDTPPHGPPSTHNTTNYVDLTLDSDE